MLTVEVVSPEQILFTGEGSMVVARTLGGGDIAFLTGHVPFLGALDDWPLRVIHDDGSQVHFAVHGGFVEVSENRVTVLSDVAETKEGIDVVRATTAREAAEAALRLNPDDADAQGALRRATIRLEVAGA